MNLYVLFHFYVITGVPLFSAQAFTKWPPIFSGETRRFCAANDSYTGLGRIFGQSGDALCRYWIKLSGLTGIFVREVIFWVQRSHVTWAIPTFCLVCQDRALCWRNCSGPGQGGASDFRLCGIFATSSQKCQQGGHALEKTQRCSFCIDLM